MTKNKSVKVESYEDAVAAYEAIASAYNELLEKVIEFEKKFISFSKEEIRFFQYYRLDEGVDKTKEIELFEERINKFLQGK